MSKVLPLLGVALNLGEVHLLAGHLQGLKTLKDAILMTALLHQKMFHHVVDQLILEVLLPIDLMLM